VRKADNKASARIQHILFEALCW